MERWTVHLLSPRTYLLSLGRLGSSSLASPHRSSLPALCTLAYRPLLASPHRQPMLAAYRTPAHRLLAHITRQLIEVHSNAACFQRMLHAMHL